MLTEKSNLISILPCIILILLFQLIIVYVAGASLNFLFEYVFFTEFTFVFWSSLFLLVVYYTIEFIVAEYSKFRKVKNELSSSLLRWNLFTHLITRSQREEIIGDLAEFKSNLISKMLCILKMIFILLFQFIVVYVAGESINFLFEYVSFAEFNFVFWGSLILLVVYYAISFVIAEYSKFHKVKNELSTSLLRWNLFTHLIPRSQREEIIGDLAEFKSNLQQQRISKNQIFWKLLHNKTSILFNLYTKRVINWISQQTEVIK